MPNLWNSDQLIEQVFSNHYWGRSARLEGKLKSMKKKTQAPNFYNFVRATASDEKAASQMLIDEPSWLHAKSSTGETALHFLAIEGDLQVVKFLIEKGADINACSNLGTTPLMHAAQIGNLDVCLLLIQKGANVNAKDELLDYTAMHYAAQSGKAEILDALLAAGGSPDVQQQYEKSVTEVVLPRKRELLLSVLKKHGYS